MQLRVSPNTVRFRTQEERRHSEARPCTEYAHGLAPESAATENTLTRDSRVEVQ